ncbi:hypothetical protein BC833DRAFT_588041 [Globomyces pollinis-pini]|nr:hypothetical protein BC833DRAFT_588041 [Globomyces pollinis-pini]
MAGVRICFDSKLPSEVINMLKRHIIAYDGDVHQQLGKETTHYCTLISTAIPTFPDFPQIKMVSPKWILDCHLQKRKLYEH